MIILILVLGFPHVEAQASPRQDFTPNLKPNLGVAFAILGTLILMTSIIFYFSKFCQTSPTIRNQREIVVGDFVTGSRSSGIDKKVIESLPFFKFSLLKGSKEGLECAVCLSKFEDIEVLRLLPKCQHAFHINCIDKWLEEHSSCPLCRSQVSANDLESLTSSTSLRFLPSFSDSHVETNLEIVIERENRERGSSRVTLESRSRESARSKKEKLLMRKTGAFRNSKVLRKFNHKIIVSGVVSKNRWSDLSSSDLLVLESEMLSSTSSKRFSCLDNNDDTREIMNREEVIDMKSVSENKAGEISGSRVSNQNERRSMSEITVHTRFDETENVPFVSENAVKEEKIKRIWLPMARETVEWLVKREKSQYTHIRKPSLNV